MVLYMQDEANCLLEYPVFQYLHEVCSNPSVFDASKNPSSPICPAQYYSLAPVLQNPIFLQALENIKTMVKFKRPFCGSFERDPSCYRLD